MQGERRGRESGGRWGGLGRSGRESVTRPRIQLRLNVRPPVASSVAPVLCAGREFSLSVPPPPFLCPCSCTGGKLSLSVRGFVAAQRGLWGPPLARGSAVPETGSRLACFLPQVLAAAARGQPSLSSGGRAACCSGSLALPLSLLERDWVPAACRGRGLGLKCFLLG